MEGRSSKPEVPILTKAHQVVIKADDAKSNRKYEQAVELYRQAAELYLHATNYTSDIDSIKHLQQLSDSLTSKATELEKQIRILSEQQQKYLSKMNNKKSPVGSPEGRAMDIPIYHRSDSFSSSSGSPSNQIHSYSPPQPHPNILSTSPHDHSVSHSVNQPLYGSQNYFVGQNAPSESNSEIVLAFPPRLKRASDSIATIQIQNESNSDFSSKDIYNNSNKPFVGYDIPLDEDRHNEMRIPYLSDVMNVDMWGWMEKMIDILPKPIVNALPYKKSEGGNEILNQSDNSIMNSFYLVSSSPTLNASGNLYQSNYHGSASKANLDGKNNTEVVKQLTEENNELKNEIQRLVLENQSLKNVCEKGIQASRENDSLKKSIVLFREEFKKKANQIRQNEIDWSQSNSVGNLPNSFKRINMNSPVSSPIANTVFGLNKFEGGKDARISQLEAKIESLNNQVKILTERNESQEKLIEKYEQKWESLKEETRRRRESLTK